MIIFTTVKGSPFTLRISRYYTSATPFDSPLSLLHLLQLSIQNQSLKLTQQSHAQVCHLGFHQHSVIVSKLISAYSLSRNPTLSKLVFDSVEFKNVYIWNTLINGYSKNLLYSESFDLFNQMCKSTVFPDEFTLSSLAKVARNFPNVLAGKMIHSKCIRIGLDSDMIVSNSIMGMYSKCDRFFEARKLFDEMPQRNVSSWNVIILGYSNLKDFSFDDEMWSLVKNMQIEGFKPDSFTVSSLLCLCDGNGVGWDYGRELHCYVVKNEVDLGLDSNSDVYLGCCLIDMYSRSKKVDFGRRVFDDMKFRNVFAWTAMINGYVESGDSDEALVLFREMQMRDKIDPNRVSLISILPACSSLAGLIGGKQIHGFTIRNELNQEVSLLNALIDMYSKCGSLNCARKIFEDKSICKDAISWSSMISGYGLHGKGQEAISLYKKMLQNQIKPDMITIVGVLSACGRSGLVDEGLDIFNSAIKDYKISPTLEIYSCVVDMLGRSGQLDRALDLIKTMHLTPGPSVWGALFSASLLHGDSEMRDLAYKFLVEIEPNNPSNYVSFSNLYASSRRWDGVAEMRSMMRERGLKKLPGCSWISIASETHSFYVADKAHPCSDMIYGMLDELILAMREVSYSSNFGDLT